MAQYDVDLREYWRIFKKRKVTVFLTAIILGVFSTIFAILKAPPPLYTSVCSIKFEKDTTVQGLYARTLSWSMSNDIETQISVLMSYPVMEKVAKKLGLIPEEATREISPLQSNVTEIIDNLQSKVSASREGLTDIINLSVTDSDPIQAQRLASTIALAYKELYAQEQSKRTTEALKYIASQLKEVRQKLRESENEFNRFTQVNQLVSIDLQSENLLVRAKELRQEIRKNKEARSGLEALRGKLEHFIKKPSGPGEGLHSTYANKRYEDASNELVELLLKKDTLLKDYTNKHPEVIEISRKITENARKMLLIVELQIGDLNKKVADLSRELGEVEKTTSELMEKKLDYDRLKRKVSSYNDMTALLEEKNQEALIRRAERPEGVSIVRPASLPTYPINPPKTAATGAIGIIIGLILGIVLGFIAETFDTSLGAIEDVEEALGAQVIGVIPHVDDKTVQDALRDKDGKSSLEFSFSRRGHLVSHFVPQSIISESFRALRTNIQFHDAENKIKTIAITSASPEEGKTMTSTNLAITMAQAGMKTLLVGSDLRKPILSKIFGVEPSPGLSDVLLGNYSWPDVIKTITDIIIGKMGLDEVMITSGLDNLHIITSGAIPPNPSELIDSKRLVDFIEEVSREYDFIIFDSSPILSTADPTILGTKLDAVLLVYRLGAISKGLLKRAAVQLSQVKVNIMGVVLNGMKAEVSPDFQDFKQYKYAYAYAEEGKSKKKFGLLKWVLLLIALVFLAFGLLWQAGILPLDTYLFKKETVLKRNEALPPEKKPVQDKKRPASSPTSVKTLPSPPDKQISSNEQSRNANGSAPLSKEVPSLRKEEPSDIKPDPLPVETVKYPYSICTESLKSRKQADEAIARLKAKGLSPYWCHVDLGAKGKWYRIFVGHFMTMAKADEFKERHSLNASRILQTAYAVQIGQYASNTELDREIASLKKAGYAPYLIDNQEKEHRLLIGAFVTRNAADELARRLKKTMGDCRVVLR